MKNNAGIWIDHRNALIVFITGDKVEIKTITSNVEKQLGRIEGVRSLAPFERQMVLGDDIQERIFTNSIEKFFDEVYSVIKNAESVLIFGPGEAKGELKKYIEKKYKGNLVIGVESVDKMTDRQVIAKVRKYFKSIVTPPSRA